MKKAYMILGITVVVLIAFTGGFYFKGFISKDTEKQAVAIKKNDTLNMASEIGESELSKSNSYNLKNYNKIVNAILHDFNLTGWEEIIGENGSIVVVPDEVAGKQEGKESIYARQKNFVFKNSQKGVVILLNVSAAKENESEWHTSIGYAPNFHNSKTNRFKDSYSDNMPNSEVYLYDFAVKGCNISIVGISDNPNNISGYTISETAIFCQKLIELMNEEV